jgi:CDP-diacylglycerol--serine O-phosphatidyltransferase
MTAAPTPHPPKPPRPKPFELIRSFVLADFITLANAACGTGSIFLCLNYLEDDHQGVWLTGALILLPFAMLFDVADGFVARWRKRSSPYGADLDSLADIVSFGVAPAVLGWTVGMRGGWDALVLIYFVCSGIGRLARFNVTAEALADENTGKVKYFEGTPIPTSLLLVGILAIAYNMDAVWENLWLGSVRIGPATLHPLVLLYFVSGTLMTSKLRIPKL